MYRIKTFNKIAPQGLERLDPARYQVGEDVAEEEGILVRSAGLLDYHFPESLLAIARAGVGVNNIPLERCSEKGIAVFSTPGANANAVKELVLCAMLIASRDVTGAVRWVKNQADAGVEVETVVEKGKAAFVGPELYRKALGVIGLGAIGSLVANVALDLGMDVYGFDPFLSVDAALRLDRHVRVVQDVNELYKKSDYITIHIHFNEKTRHMIGPEAFAAMKPGARLINLARGGVVNDEALLAALDAGKVTAYVTDFPTNKLVANPHVIAMPHLGASTPESEDNCAQMAVDQMKEYLENGNIINSVNLPSLSMPREPGTQRICVIHRNIPGAIADFTTVCGKAGINIENMQSKSRKDYAYTILDVQGGDTAAAAQSLETLDAIIRVRVISA